ncbi:MAG: enoyl-CoA hydratase/isomerase family protein [Verrucomicrobiota bacterium]
MTTEIVLTYPADVCYITLTPPSGKPPTLDYHVIEAFDRALDEITSRAAQLAAVVLQSASPKFFCAGANINVLQTIDRDSIKPWVRRGHELMNRLEALPLPVIARVEGYAMGGGLELAMACDMIVASSSARFAQSEAKLGLVTGWGGCYRLARRVGLARAKELCFTGRILEPAEAVQLGIAEWQGEPAALEQYLQELLTAISRNGRVALREMKHILASCAGSTLEENMHLEAEASSRCLSEGDGAQRLHAFLSSRKGDRANTTDPKPASPKAG